MELPSSLGLEGEGSSVFIRTCRGRASYGAGYSERASDFLLAWKDDPENKHWDPSPLPSLPPSFCWAPQWKPEQTPERKPLIQSKQISFTRESRVTADGTGGSSRNFLALLSSRSPDMGSRHRLSVLNHLNGSMTGFPTSVFLPFHSETNCPKTHEGQGWKAPYACSRLSHLGCLNPARTFPQAILKPAFIDLFILMETYLRFDSSPNIALKSAPQKLPPLLLVTRVQRESSLSSPQEPSAPAF